VTREDEDDLLAGEFNGIPSRKEQPNQWPQLGKHTIESSILTDLIFMKTAEEE
jgi:hypothetical protein